MSDDFFSNFADIFNQPEHRFQLVTCNSRIQNWLTDGLNNIGQLMCLKRFKYILELSKDTETIFLRT